MALPKNKTIVNIDDYTGFRWNGMHTSQLGLTIVSSSSRYSLNPISSITNNTVDVPGGDGQYFFNSTYGPKKWTINFVFDNLDDYQWRDLLNWLYHKDTSDLVFDELPYKAYNAKLEGTPSVNYLCFDETRAKQDDTSLDKDTLEQVNWEDIDNIAPASPSYVTHETDGTDNFDTMYYKKRIYKGEGTLNFVAFFPYAYSARNYDGKYMKYLDEIIYFPDLHNQYTQEIGIGNTGALSIKGRNNVGIFSIKGNTIITFVDDEQVDLEFLTEEQTDLKNSVQLDRGSIGKNSKKEKLIINCKQDNRTLTKIFSLPVESEEDIVYFDRVQDYYDEIVFSEEKKKYQLIKRIGTFDLQTDEHFNKAISNFLIVREASHEKEHKVLSISLKKILSKYWDELIALNSTEVSATSFFNTTLCKLIEENQAISENITNLPKFFCTITYQTKSRGQKIVDIVLNLYDYSVEEDGSYSYSYLKKVQSKCQDTKEKLSQNEAIEQSVDMLLFYVHQDKLIDIRDENESRDLLQIQADNDLYFSIANKNSSSQSLNYRTIFTITPTLYDNIEEWKDSSGLREKKTEYNETYDLCQKYGEDVTYGYKVYNGGDLPTPFRVKIPVNRNRFNYSNDEISFVLLKKEDENIIDLNNEIEITEINQLEKTVPYRIESLGDEYKYFYTRVLDYATLTIEILDIERAEYLNFSFSNDKIYKRDKIKNQFNVIDSFSIRFNNKDSINSYLDVVNGLCGAAATQSRIDNILEIDTYKQTINFISNTNYENSKENIIPMYFSLCRGELFKIPPKVDNLYLLVYNQRKSGDGTFITNKYKEVPEIEYRYLYL